MLGHSDADQVGAVDGVLHDADARRIDHHAIDVNRADAFGERLIVGRLLRTGGGDLGC